MARRKSRRWSIRVRELTREKAELSSDLTQLRDRIDKLRPEAQQLEKTVAALSRELDTLNSRLPAERNLLAQLEQRQAEADRQRQAAIAERNQVVAERDAARAEREGIVKSIEALKALAEGLRRDLEKSGAVADGNYADLFRSITFPELRIGPRQSEERNALEHAARYIAGRGLHFPERILHSFHTCLKTNDISPLLVLAGISGTGKSELPRHYADGMGMHFLLTAVQPRWDSPQDLFGFYNYLEKRYKATELARAMVQFERYNQCEWDLPDGSDVDDRSDRMLLVLLDEMNLARTESILLRVPQQTGDAPERPA